MVDFFKFKVNNFELHKKNLIDLILKLPKNSITMEPDKSTISNTDFNLIKEIKNGYILYFINNIFRDYVKFLCNKLNCKKIELDNIWFQIYEQGDSHGYHIHPGCNFTNIFFLSLPNKNIKTQIKLPNGDELKNEASEGEIISFPAYYHHKSPKNEYEEPKIIIAFNTNIVE